MCCKWRDLQDLRLETISRTNAINGITVSLGVKDNNYCNVLQHMS